MPNLNEFISNANGTENFKAVLPLEIQHVLGFTKPDLMDRCTAINNGDALAKTREIRALIGDLDLRILVQQAEDKLAKPDGTFDVETANLFVRPAIEAIKKDLLG